MLAEYLLEYPAIQPCKLLVAPRLELNQVYWLHVLEGFAKLFLEELFAEANLQ